MIRYKDASVRVLKAVVDEHKASWRKSAHKKTTTIKKKKKYIKGSPSWSDIKPVYMRLQHNKCVFCERPLGGEVAGKIEQDVEHFRPKNALKLWPAKAKKSQAPSYSFSTGGVGGGYYWLAYDLENYAAACKPCNSTRKSNYFPVAGTKRGSNHETVATLNQLERPFLIYPLGTLDDDPETLIGFDGILAKPINANGHNHNRALITIDFFALNTREELWADRFRTISDLWFKFQIVSTSKSKQQKDAAQRGINDLVSDAGPQAGCARAFLRLIEADPVKAWETFVIAEEYRKTGSRPGMAPARRRAA
jgi:hypothetical protein